MNIYSFCIILLIIASPIYNQNTNLSSENDIDGIIVFLNPFNVSNFILNKYYPNQNDDISYYSTRFDGSTNFPLYQSIPEKFYFDISEDGNISQLKYQQRKSNKYFDTSIALKNDINIDTDFLLQIESKSIVDNINQNFFIGYNKSNEKFILDISYIYHYEKDPEHYILMNNQNFLKKFESFNPGFSLEYNFTNAVYKTQASIQTSYYKRPEEFNGYNYIEYDQQVIWFDNNVQYSFSNNFSYFINNSYKRVSTQDIETDQLFFRYSENIVSSILQYKLNNIFTINVGVDYMDYEIKPSLAVNLKFNKFNFNFSIENSFETSLNENSNTKFGDYAFYARERYNFAISFDSRSYHNSLNTGYVNSQLLEYNYMLLDGFLDINKFKIDYRYYVYYDMKKQNLNLDEYSNYGLSYYPFKGKYKFELYGKINYYQYHLLSSINLLSLGLFDDTVAVDNNVQLYNFEIGIIFNAFSIAYKRKNALNREVIYSNLINPYELMDYIDITWIFKD